MERRTGAAQLVPTASISSRAAQRMVVIYACDSLLTTTTGEHIPSKP